MSDYVTVVLLCGHRDTVTIDAIFSNAEFDCFACKLPSAWIAFHYMNKGYGFICKGCRYSRAYGPAKISSETAAAKHMIRKGHKLTLTLDGLIYKTIEPQREVLF